LYKVTSTFEQKKKNAKGGEKEKISRHRQSSYPGSGGGETSDMQTPQTEKVTPPLQTKKKKTKGGKEEIRASTGVYVAWERESLQRRGLGETEWDI